MSKRRGNCKHFSYTHGDLDAREHPDGGDWGFCNAPVPMYVEDVSHGEVGASDKAKKCETYVRKELG